MRKIGDILKAKPHTFSFEFFPPKTPEGHQRLYETAEKFAELGADYFSVTYGAGGAPSADTFDIVNEIQARTHLPVMHHYICIGHSRATITQALEQMRRADISNIMAMRGDLPLDQANYQPSPDELRYGYQLVVFIRYQFGDYFCIAVPGFPEKHAFAPTAELDSEYLKLKQDAGADFVVTQMFFDNADYYNYLQQIRQADVTIPIIPGILPITDYDKLVTFCHNCGARLSQSIIDTFEPLRSRPQATYDEGIEVVTRQCQDLLDHGAPGLHFFCLNKYEPAATIFKSLKVQGQPVAREPLPAHG